MRKANTTTRNVRVMLHPSIAYSIKRGLVPLAKHGSDRHNTIKAMIASVIENDDKYSIQVPAGPTE